MRSLLLLYSTGMKSLLSPWLQNIYFSPFLWIPVPFLWILVPFLWILVPFLWIPVPFRWIPVDSGGMAPFLQESVGQGEVLPKCRSTIDVLQMLLLKSHLISMSRKFRELRG